MRPINETRMMQDLRIEKDNVEDKLEIQETRVMESKLIKKSWMQELIKI